MPVTARTPESSQRVVGDVWPIDVEVTDADRFPITQTPTVTITLPDGSTTTVVPQLLRHGCYRAGYTLTVPGRHLAAAVAAGYGRADFVLDAVAPTPAGGLPQLADAKKYLGETSWDDDDVQGALNAETAAQAAICAVPAYYPDDLREALLRRVWRNLSMRGQPFLTVPGGDDGLVSVAPTLDAEIRRFEKPYLRMLFA
jgi:hypothetical protein